MTIQNRKCLLIGFDKKKKIQVTKITAPKNQDLHKFMQEKCFESTLRGSTWAYKPLKRDLWDRYLTLYIWGEGEDVETEMCRISTYEDAYKFLKDEGGESGWCGIYDLLKEKQLKFDVISWKNRDDAKSTKEAMSFIAHHLSEKWDGRLLLKEVEEYATKHQIPFSVAFIKQFRQAFQLHQPQWNSSSAYC